MSTRKQRMQTLKEWLITNPLYIVEIPTPEDPSDARVRDRQSRGDTRKVDYFITSILCGVHAESFPRKKKVAVYQMTNYGETYRKCEEPGCTYRILHHQLP